MQIGRLFEIVYLLLERGNMTAKELAERFEVSVRTIHRDVEALSQARIPVYTERGSRGGIRLMDDFVLDKLVLSEKEREGVLDALQGLRALRVEGAEQALRKLSAVFGGARDWIQIDFSAWYAGDWVSKRFGVLKEAIWQGRTVAFSYSGMRGETAERVVEPLKLVFRGYDWYLLGWCREREDYRFFKLTRMGEPEIGEAYGREPRPPLPEMQEGSDGKGGETAEILAVVRKDWAWRVFDEAPPESREMLMDGSVKVTFRMEKTEWMYSYLMTYGAGMEVLEPEWVREGLRQRLNAAAAQYNPSPAK